MVECLHCLISIGMPRRIRLIEIETEVWHALDRFSDHFDTVIQRCLCIRGFLVWRIAVRQKPDLIQSEIFIGKFSEKQMADMDRIKCSS